MGEAELRLVGRVEHVDVDRAELAQRGSLGCHDPAGLLDRRVVRLHVAQEQASGRRRRGQPVRLGDRRREGLLAQDGKPGIEGGQRDGSVRAGRQHDDAVQLWSRDQVRHVPEAAVDWHAIPGADRREQGRRQVRQGRDLERRAEAGEERQVDGLGDGAEAGDTHPDATTGARAGRGAHGGRV